MALPPLDERADALSAPRGFTLLELTIVLFIMGLMLTIVLPYVGGLRTEQLKSVARRLAGRASYLYDQASAQKVVIRLIFDLNHNVYAVARLDPYSAQPRFVPDRTRAGAPVAMPAEVRIRDVTVEGAGTFTEGRVACQFYPEGYVDATTVHLTDASDHVMTLFFNPLTGRVSIANGDLRQDRSFRQ